jgi:hypothetical protein
MDNVQNCELYRILTLTAVYCLPVGQQRWAPLQHYRVPQRELSESVQLEYLDLTFHRREVGEVFVVVGRAPSMLTSMEGNAVQAFSK